jgi:hypothetical protein
MALLPPPPLPVPSTRTRLRLSTFLTLVTFLAICVGRAGAGVDMSVGLPVLGVLPIRIAAAFDASSGASASTAADAAPLVDAVATRMHDTIARAAARGGGGGGDAKKSNGPLLPVASPPVTASSPQDPFIASAAALGLSVLSIDNAGTLLNDDEYDSVEAAATLGTLTGKAPDLADLITRLSSKFPLPKTIVAKDWPRSLSALSLLAVTRAQSPSVSISNLASMATVEIASLPVPKPLTSLPTSAAAAVKKLSKIEPIEQVSISTRPSSSSQYFDDGSSPPASSSSSSLSNDSADDTLKRKGGGGADGRKTHQRIDLTPQNPSVSSPLTYIELFFSPEVTAAAVAVLLISIVGVLTAFTVAWLSLAQVQAAADDARLKRAVRDAARDAAREINNTMNGRKARVTNAASSSGEGTPTAAAAACKLVKEKNATASSPSAAAAAAAAAAAEISKLSTSSISTTTINAVVVEGKGGGGGAEKEIKLIYFETGL